MQLPHLPDLLALHHVASLRSVEVAAAALKERPEDVLLRLDRLEVAYGSALVEPTDGGLSLTPEGQVVEDYAQRILGLAREAQRAVRTGVDEVEQVRVGLADVLPKVLAWRLLSPIRCSPGPRVTLRCTQGTTEQLDQQVALGALDLVLSDVGRPAAPAVDVVLLGTTGLSLFASRKLADALAGRGPRWLDGAPMLLPAPGTRLRLALDGWLADHLLQPQVVGEFADSALLKAFAAEGAGFFAMHDAVAHHLQRGRGFVRLAGLSGLEQRVFAHIRSDSRSRAAIDRLLLHAPAAFSEDHETGFLPLD